MPAVEAVLQLYALGSEDGFITALDSYGSDVHLGTSTGQLIRLAVVEAAEHPKAPERPPADGGDTATPTTALSTSVARRCALSTSGAAVQQVQHSRSQRVVFVLCEGRLLLLNAATYAVLSTVAANVVSFSVAQPVARGGVAVGAGESGLHSRTLSHTRTPSEPSIGSSPMWSPRSTVAYPASPAAPFLQASSTSRRSAGGGKAHVVCVAEKNKRELAVYLVDRVSTKSSPGGSSRSSAMVAARSAQLPSLAAPAGGADAAGGAAEENARSSPSSHPTVSSSNSSAFAPRVVLRQRFVLPEPAQAVVMCAPVPQTALFAAASAAQDHVDRSLFAGGTDAAGAAALPAGVEAGLTVCVGMRREVSLLPLIGGAPRCVLRLDGSRPPLLSLGSDHNTYLVRTQAPNTVMEVGVPRSLASAGLTGGDAGGGGGSARALMNPIEARISYQRTSAYSSGSRDGVLTAAVQPSREDELIMGDVFQSDAVVELVLARFPYVFLFSAQHCDVVSLLDDGTTGSAATAAAAGAASANAATAHLQRIPLAGVRHGALRGQGRSLFVASERVVWALQLYPLRLQLAEMVRVGQCDEALRLLAFHQERAAAAASSPSAGGEGRSLGVLERDLHRMIGFTDLSRGAVAAGIRALRGYIDPREVLLCLPDCIPPRALRALKEKKLPPATEVFVRASPAFGAPECYVVRSADANITAAAVRRFLGRPSWGDSGEGGDARGRVAAPAADVRGRLGGPPASYWDRWAGGACVHNNCAGDVARVWMAAYEAETHRHAADAAVFVAANYDTLKTEVRAWFTEEVFTAIASASTGAGAGHAGRDEPHARSGCTTPHPAERRDDGHDGGAAAAAALCSPAAEPLRASSLRAMAYASLVLAIQARDFCTAYHLASAAGVVGLQPEDCSDVLLHLGECRLLALVHFRHGGGEECARLLRRHVWQTRRCLCSSTAVARQDDGDDGANRDDAAPLHEWRQCMLERFLSAGGTPDARVVRPLRRAAPVLGLGFLMQPSLAHVARAARLLFGVHPRGGADKALVGSAEEVRGLLGELVACYTSRGDARPRVAGAGFAFLHYTAADNGAAEPFTLPHAGPVLTTAAPPLLSAGEAKPVPAAAGACVLPSALSEYLYAVEKLDVVRVRQLLQRQPLLAHARDVDGANGLHVALGQLHRVCGAADAAGAPSWHLHARERLAASQAMGIEVVCAVVGLLVQLGCPADVLTCDGWSCLDVAAAACRRNAAVFDTVAAALFAAMEVREAK